MKKDKHQPRIYQCTPNFYQYKIQQGVIYSNNQNSTNLDSLVGTILDGIFQKGKTNEATFYGNYTKGWLEAKWDLENKIYGEGYQFSQNGQLIYKGNFYKNTRTGSGEQWFGQDSFKGYWKNGLREGEFVQKTKNNKLQSHGYYVKHQKIGLWKYKYEDEVYQKIFNSQKQIDQFNNQNHKNENEKDISYFPKQQILKIEESSKNINQKVQIKNIQLNHQVQYKRSCCSSFVCFFFCCYQWPLNKGSITKQKIPIKPIVQTSQSMLIKKQVSQQQNPSKLKTINLQQITIKQSVLSKTSLLNQQIKYIDPFEISTHKSLLTQTSYENLLDENKMIDDSVIEAWSMILQFYIFNTMNDRVIILPICLMKQYAGRDLKNRNYKYVKYYTKQFNQCFSLLNLYGDNKQKIILIPIIKNTHYVLAVIEIKKDEKLKCKIYDSLKFKHGVVKQPSKNIYWSAIRDYLKDYINQYNNSDVELVKSVDEMSLCFEQCPSQQDGLSCGVFISIFMYYFAINKQNELKKLYISKQRIHRFRTQTSINILKNNQINFQDIDNIYKVFVKNISIKK